MGPNSHSAAKPGKFEPGEPAVRQGFSILSAIKDQIIHFFVQNTCLILYYTFLSSRGHFKGVPSVGAKTTARANLLNLGCENKIQRNLE